MGAGDLPEPSHPAHYATHDGQDLSERVMRGASDIDLGSSLEKNYNPLVRGLRELGMPVLCAVNGVAAGAGCNVALAADIVIAARSASFIEAFSRIGLIPDAGGTYVLPRLVGTARAMALSLLAEPVSAEQAASWGLIWRCVDDDKLMSEARPGSTPGLGPYARVQPDQTGAQRLAGQYAGPATGARSSVAARSGTDRGLQRGGQGIPGKAGPALRRPLTGGIATSRHRRWPEHRHRALALSQRQGAYLCCGAETCP